VHRPGRVPGALKHGRPHQGIAQCIPDGEGDGGHLTCRRELLDRTLIWNQRHLMIVLREYEDFYNTHRPHRALNQAAPFRPLPDSVTDLDHFRVQRRDRAGGVLHEYHLVA
jgi:hypothetical protein